MSITKSFQTTAMFIVIPLLLCVMNDKITLTTALDLIVWYIAISFGVFIFKTPLKLYWQIKGKRRVLLERKNFIDQEQFDKRNIDLLSLEWRMFIFSICSPFLALIAWYTLEQFCSRYALNSLSQLLHPYYIIIAGFVSTFQPIKHFMNHFSERANEVYLHDTLPSGGFSGGLDELRSSFSRLNHTTSGVGAGVSLKSPNRDRSDSSGHSSPTSPPILVDEGQLKTYVFNQAKHSEDSIRNEINQIRLEFSNHLKTLNGELMLLKRDIRDWTNKKDQDSLRLEGRVLNLENQLELYQILEKEKEKSTQQHGLFSMLSPYKLLPFHQR